MFVCRLAAGAGPHWRSPCAYHGAGRRLLMRRDRSAAAMAAAHVLIVDSEQYLQALKDVRLHHAPSSSTPVPSRSIPSRSIPFHPVPSRPIPPRPTPSHPCLRWLAPARRLAAEAIPPLAADAAPARPCGLTRAAAHAPLGRSRRAVAGRHSGSRSRSVPRWVPARTPSAALGRAPPVATGRAVLQSVAAQCVTGALCCNILCRGATHTAGE